MSQGNYIPMNVVAILTTFLLSDERQTLNTQVRRYHRNTTDAKITIIDWLLVVQRLDKFFVHVQGES